uniref:Uncharacterized protein n=1 Tax=Panagrolaimus sp. JU765 TaxID=591449 RepID=A0AC34QIB2_9BILA
MGKSWCFQSLVQVDDRILTDPESCPHFWRFNFKRFQGLLDPVCHQDRKIMQKNEVILLCVAIASCLLAILWFGLAIYMWKKEKHARMVFETESAESPALVIDDEKLAEAKIRTKAVKIVPRDRKKKKKNEKSEVGAPNEVEALDGGEKKETVQCRVQKTKKKPTTVEPTQESDKEVEPKKDKVKSGKIVKQEAKKVDPTQESSSEVKTEMKKAEVTPDAGPKVDVTQDSDEKTPNTPQTLK